MGEPKVLVKSRRYIRGRVTALFNQRDSFSTLSQLDRDIKKSTLGDHLADLKEYNALIQNSKWSDDDDGLERELKECEEYFTKINSCLCSISGISAATPSPATSSDVIRGARSSLKSPTAPLPTYNGSEEQDLSRFFF